MGPHFPGQVNAILKRASKSPELKVSNQKYVVHVWRRWYRLYRSSRRGTCGWRLAARQRRRHPATRCMLPMLLYWIVATERWSCVVLHINQTNRLRCNDDVWLRNARAYVKGPESWARHSCLKSYLSRTWTKSESHTYLFMFHFVSISSCTRVLEPCKCSTVDEGNSPTALLN